MRKKVKEKQFYITEGLRRVSRIWQVFNSFILQKFYKAISLLFFIDDYNYDQRYFKFIFQSTYIKYILNKLFFVVSINSLSYLRMLYIPISGQYWFKKSSFMLSEGRLPSGVIYITCIISPSDWFAIDIPCIVPALGIDREAASIGVTLWPITTRGRWFIAKTPRDHLVDR